MEQDNWKDFLNKDIKIIIEDKPSPYPKHKEGILEKISTTHLIIRKSDGSIEALRLIDIRRVELKNKEAK